MKENGRSISITKMKKIVLVLVFLFTGLFGNAANELDRQIVEYRTVNKVQEVTQKVDDYTFIRRLYLDVAGRIPTTKELQEYLSSREPNKKQQLIERLLYSEDYVNNWQNFFSDLFRIRPERLNDSSQIKGYPYIEYLRDSLRLDKSYEVLVKELLTAEGSPLDNGASGYILRDDGMTFDNLALSSQIFIGKNISCAQCHDDPFSDYTQKQYYELAAFMKNDNRQTVPEYQAKSKTVDEDIKRINKNDRIDNGVRQIMSGNLVAIRENPNKTLRLPHDYKYDDAKPNDLVSPQTLDGQVKTGGRAELAKWITGHPDFSRAIINRIWQQIIGNNLFYPQSISDIDIAADSVKDRRQLIEFLGQYFTQNSHSLKSVIRLIVSSDFYTSQSYTGSAETYRFQGPWVKRLTAYQLWDSILTLILPDVNYSRISLDRYSELYKIDWSKISGQYMLDKQNQIRDWDNQLMNSFLKIGNIDLVRSCFNYRGPNSFIGQFLKEFGASERILLDTSNTHGTVTQLLTFMNGPLINVVTSSKSQLMTVSADKNLIFMTIMGRPYHLAEEKSMIDNQKTEDLVWILLNTNEFLFRK